MLLLLLLPIAKSSIKTQHHQLAKTIGEWPFDSYNAILSDKPTSLFRKEVIEWFGSKEAFITFHQQPIYPKKGITDI